jgi:hypothetical protein
MDGVHSATVLIFFEYPFDVAPRTLMENKIEELCFVGYYPKKKRRTNNEIICYDDLFVIRFRNLVEMKSRVLNCFNAFF